MFLPPLLSELKGTSQTLGQLDFRSLLGFSSPLEHKLFEVMLIGKFLGFFYNSHKPRNSLVFQLHSLYSSTEVNDKEQWIEREPGQVQQQRLVGRHELYQHKKVYFGWRKASTFCWL